MSTEGQPFVPANPAAVPTRIDPGPPVPPPQPQPVEPPAPEVEDKAPAQADAPGDASLLSRHEQMLLQREGQIIAQERELKRLRDLEQSLRQDPVTVATQHGASMDAWLERFGSSSDNAQASQGTVDPMVAKRIEELENQLQEQQRAKQVAEQQAQQDQIREATLAQIAKTVEGDDSLSWLKVAGLENEVYNLIESHAYRTQQQYGVPHLLDTAVAAKQVRDAYKPKLQEMLEGLAQVAEFRPVFAKVAAAVNAPQPPVPGAVGPTSITANVASSTPGHAQGMTREQAMAAKRAKWAALLQAQQNTR